MKRNIRRLLVTLGVLAALLAAATTVLLFIFRTPPLPPLPNPNGYDDLLKAGQIVVGKLDDAADLPHEELRTLVATNAEALRLLRVGLGRPCAIPTDDHIANFQTVSRDLVALRKLAKLLSAEGRLAEIDDRPADAVRSYVDSIRLGRAITRGGLMIDRLVGMACEGVGTIPFVKLLPKLTCEQMRPLAAELKQIDDSTVPWREVLQNERRFSRAQMRQVPNPLALLSYLWRERGISRRVQEQHDVAAARLRLLAVELALHSWKCDHGAAPTNLTQLVPKYLRHLPADPFTGKPFVYRPTGTNWVLYSVGPDRVDEGGKPMTKTSDNSLVGFGQTQSPKIQNKGDLLYDSKW